MSTVDPASIWRRWARRVKECCQSAIPPHCVLSAVKIPTRILFQTVCFALFFIQTALAQPYFIALTEDASIAYFSKTGALMATVPLRGGAKAENIVDFEIGDFISGHTGPEILVLRKDYYCDIYPMSGAVKQEKRLEYLRFDPNDDNIPICCNMGGTDEGAANLYLCIFTSKGGNRFISRMRRFGMPDTKQRKQKSAAVSDFGSDKSTKCLAAATSLYGVDNSFACISSDGSVRVCQMFGDSLEIDKSALAGKLPSKVIARHVHFVRGRLCVLDDQNNIYLFTQDSTGKWQRSGDAVRLKCKIGLLSARELNR
jgi:hypothetical protein